MIDKCWHDRLNARGYRPATGEYPTYRQAAVAERLLRERGHTNLWIMQNEFIRKTFCVCELVGVDPLNRFILS